MGPTCSIIYENEPMEGNLMLQKPRPLTSTFFNIREIIISIIQGIAITIGLLFIYQYCVFQNCTENETRTVVFLTLIASNIFLTLANRSFYYSILTTLKYKNNLVPMIIGITVFVTALLLFIPAFSDFFKFDLVSTKQIALSIAVGGISVLWIEIYKGIKRMKKQ
jgi:Ca2+-transporting ATPase